MMDAETMNLYKIFVGSVRREEYLRDLDVNGRSILLVELILNEINYYDVDCMHLGHNRYHQ